MLNEQAAVRFLLGAVAVVFCGPAGAFVVFVIVAVVDLYSLLKLHNWGAPSRIAGTRRAMIADLAFCAGFAIVMSMWSWGGLLGCRLK